jgi:hypothetical protein
VRPELPEVLVNDVGEVLQLVARRRVGFLRRRDPLVNLLLQHRDAVHEQLQRLIVGQEPGRHVGDRRRLGDRREPAIDAVAEVQRPLGEHVRLQAVVVGLLLVVFVQNEVERPGHVPVGLLVVVENGQQVDDELLEQDGALLAGVLLVERVALLDALRLRELLVAPLDAGLQRPFHFAVFGVVVGQGAGGRAAGEPAACGGKQAERPEGDGGSAESGHDASSR